MSRAYGANAKLHMKKEAVYGVAATGDYFQMPFNSNRAGGAQGLITDPVLGQGREGYPPQLDTISVGGAIVVPADLRYVGLWLLGAFGTPTTTEDDGVYTHTFKSGGLGLPSFTIEKGHPEIPAYQKMVGAVVDSIGFDFARSGFAQVSVEVVAQGEEDVTASSGAGTPEVLDYTPFSQFRGALKSSGVLLGNVVSGSVRYSNNLERVETIRADGKIDGVDATQASTSAELAIRWATMEFYNKARAGTPMDLEFSYTLDADQKLVMTIHEAYLPVPSHEVTGPGGIEARYTMQGAKNAIAGCAMTVVLVNNLPGTVYA